MPQTKKKKILVQKACFSKLRSRWRKTDVWDIDGLNTHRSDLLVSVSAPLTQHYLLQGPSGQGL